DRNKGFPLFSPTKIRSGQEKWDEQTIALSMLRPGISCPGRSRGPRPLSRSPFSIQFAKDDLDSHLLDGREQTRHNSFGEHRVEPFWYPARRLFHDLLLNKILVARQPSSPVFDRAVQQCLCLALCPERL